MTMGTNKFDLKLARELMGFRYGDHDRRIYQRMVERHGRSESRADFERAEGITLVEVLLTADQLNAAGLKSWATEVAEDFWESACELQRGSTFSPYGAALVHQAATAYFQWQSDHIDNELARLRDSDAD